MPSSSSFTRIGVHAPDDRPAGAGGEIGAGNTRHVLQRIGKIVAALLQDVAAR